MNNEMYIKENKKKSWNGSYKGVAFEIIHWVSPPNSIEPQERHHWCHYITLFLDRIPEKYKPLSFWLKGKKTDIGSHIMYDYYHHPIIGAVEFHGGCTFYSKENGFDGDTKVIKIGCDYQHSWDEGQRYSLEYVKSQVIDTIDSFRSLVPDYKYWCTGNGKLYSESEGIIKDGTFYSMEYFGDKEWFINILKEQNEEAQS